VFLKNLKKTGGLFFFVKKTGLFSTLLGTAFPHLFFSTAPLAECITEAWIRISSKYVAESKG